MQRARRQVDALVLESPVLDWIATLKANCVRAGLPASAALLAVPWLTLAPLSRAIGLPAQFPLRALDWIARAHELKTPTLILHGTRDDSAPLSVARSLAGLRPDIVQLEEFDAGSHDDLELRPRALAERGFVLADGSAAADEA